MQPPARPEPEIRFLRDGAGRSIAYAVSGSGPVVICGVPSGVVVVIP